MKLVSSFLSLGIAALSVSGCSGISAQSDSSDSSQAPVASATSSTAEPNEIGAAEPLVYRVLYTGKLAATVEELRQQALEAAAETVRAQGYTHFAVIEERSEMVAGSGPVSAVTASVPIKRSQRRGSRSSRGGPSTTIQLGQPKVPAYLLRITPFTDQVPDNAKAVYSVEAFP
jgi:hypothetical protein